MTDRESKSTSSSSVNVAPDKPLPPPEPSAGADDRTVISKDAPIGMHSVTRVVTPHELGTALAGEKLDHFVLESFIGGGGMGAVFRALDTRLNREVALKVLSADQSADEETRRRFQNEAQSAARLDHPNIARVYYVGEDRGLSYIALEFIEGTNVRELVERNGPLAIDEALSYLMQMADALAHASSRDVIHRDIKPSNIVISPDGRAKLVDMGLARLHQVSASSADLTASGVTLGTFDYISPEQARDPRDADVRSDIYSLGCTFYYMLTGRPPFPEGTVLQKLLQHQTDEPPDPRDYNPSLHADVTELIRKMLAKDPRRRYQTAEELQADVAALAERLGVRAAGWEATSWGEQPELKLWERHLPWIAPVAALLLIVLGLQLLATWNSSDIPLDVAQSTDADEANAVATDSTPDRSQATSAAAVARSSNATTTTADSPKRTAETNQTTGSASRNSASRRDAVDESSADDEEAMGVDAESMEDDAPASATSGMDDEVETEADGAGGAASPTSDTSRPDIVRVLNTGRGQERTFASLSDAWSAMRSGDVVELLTNETLRIEPLTLTSAVEIRAGEGYHPVIVFQPTADLVKSRREMVTLAGASLRVVGLAIEMDVPPEYLDGSWSLFHLQAAEDVSFERCSFTIRNSFGGQSSFHTDVAFFRIEAPPGSDSMMMMPTPMMTPTRTRLHLEDCIVRGEAVVVRSEDLHPFDFSWNNGMLATTDELLYVTGSSNSARSDTEVRLELRHLTSSVQSNYFQFENSADAKYLPRTTVECVDSILISPEKKPLVEHRGVSTVEEFKSQFHWNAENIFYQDFSDEEFWTILDRTGIPLAKINWFELPIDWIRSGERRVNKLRFWQLPAPNKAEHSFTLDDLRLADSRVPGVWKAGTDGRDVGMLAERLPVLPEQNPTAEDGDRVSNSTAATTVD